MPALKTKNDSRVVSFSLHKKSNGDAGDQTVSTMNHQTISLPIANIHGQAVARQQVQAQPQPKPHLVPLPSKEKRKSSRNLPFMVRANKCLQTVLVAMCGIAICSYGLDVVVSHDVGKLQGQARRLSEQNSELSAKLLKSISYGELKDSVVGRFGLRVPDQVHIVKKVEAPEANSFFSHRHDLPLISGY